MHDCINPHNLRSNAKSLHSTALTTEYGIQSSLNDYVLMYSVQNTNNLYTCRYVALALLYPYMYRSSHYYTIKSTVLHTEYSENRASLFTIAMQDEVQSIAHRSALHLAKSTA